MREGVKLISRKRGGEELGREREERWEGGRVYHSGEERGVARIEAPEIYQKKSPSSRRSYKKERREKEKEKEKESGRIGSSTVVL